MSKCSEGGLTRQFREWRSRLSNADFTVSARTCLLPGAAADRDRSGAGPAAIRVCRDGTASGLSLEAERRVRDHKLYLEEYFASSRPLWQSSEIDTARCPMLRLALRAMHETGLLQIIIPVWEQIECLVVRDFYHRYTVDEHTLVTLEYLEELKATTGRGSPPFPRTPRRNTRICRSCSWR